MYSSRPITLVACSLRSPAHLKLYVLIVMLLLVRCVCVYLFCVLQLEFEYRVVLPIVLYGVFCLLIDL